MKEKRFEEIYLGDTKNELTTKARRDWVEAEGIEWMDLEWDVLLGIGLLIEREYGRLQAL
jgi:hypothetical protein